MTTPKPVRMWAVYTNDKNQICGNTQPGFDSVPMFVFFDKNAANIYWRYMVGVVRRTCPSVKNPESWYTVRPVTITPDPESEKSDE